jgi:hypothetical protein
LQLAAVYKLYIVPGKQWRSHIEHTTEITQRTQFTAHSSQLTAHSSHLLLLVIRWDPLTPYGVQNDNTLNYAKK